MRVKTQLVAVLANRRQLVPCTMFSHIPTPSSAPTCQWDGKNQGSWGVSSHFHTCCIQLR